MGMLSSPQHTLDAWTVRKSTLKILILETCKMPRTEILRIRNCFHINVIYFYLELMSKSVSLKMLGLKLEKMDCIVL